MHYLRVALLILSLGALFGFSEENRKLNRLANEKSPYLLQHADNPIDWYPWGEEAFAKAKKERKPVFLSIGYSTCHWCHVMERECFRDNEVARYLNQKFVSIKVDREERPDIDNAYMKAARYLGSGGGWPLTIVMTPDKKPFFAGTYIPKFPKYNLEGLMTLLPRLYRQYRYNSSIVSDAIKRVEERIERSKAAGMRPVRHLPEIDSNAVFSSITSRFDSANGGFTAGMKFPRSHQLLYLLQYYKNSGNELALQMAKNTVDEIRFGGITDHVGGGIHRYTVDSQWKIPHFEKMLYNQALFTMALTDLYKISGDELYKKEAYKIFAYVADKLTSKDGAFYSAENADSEEEEGAFYLWRYDELAELLSKKDLEFLAKIYKIEKSGNWTDHATEEKQPTNILYVTDSGRDFLNKANKKDLARLEEIRLKLYNSREKRIHPSTDDKVLTNWNGLMIASLAKASLVFEDEELLNSAEKAYNFIKNNLYKDGKLMHRWREEADVEAMLTDYTFLAWGAIELYKSTQDIKYLHDGAGLGRKVVEAFSHENNGFYMTSKDAQVVLERQFVSQDMAIPSGNSATMLVFSELARFTADEFFMDQAEKQKKYMSAGLIYAALRRSFSGYAYELDKLGSTEIVLVSNGDDSELEKFIKEVKKSSKRVYLHVKTEANSQELGKLAPFTKEHKSVNGAITAYVCENFSCKKPVTTIDELRKLLE